MMKSALWIFALLLLSAATGPLTFVMSQAGHRDTADVYIVLMPPSKSELSQDLSMLGGREIGPVQGMFGRMIIAPSTAHARLKKAGYTMLPASALAGLCGIETTSQQFAYRN